MPNKNSEPNQKINTIVIFASIIAALAGFAIVYGKYSDKIKPSQPTEINLISDMTGSEDFEMVLDWMYKIQLSEWLNIQPDVQYVIKPGGTGEIPNALVIGFQLSVSI